MAGGKTTVRQKMINMMYLVLTALLALNVSKDILKAFHLVEVSMTKSGVNIDQKNKDLMAAFAKANSTQPDKVGPYYTKAQKADKINNDFIAYMDELIAKVVEGAGGRKDGDPEAELAMNDNIEKHADLFMNQGKGQELKDKINGTREQLLALLDAEDKKAVKSDLVANDPEGSQTWQSEYFEHSPAASVVTMLVKIKNDCKNTTAQVLDQLAKAITKDDRTFDKVVAKIIPRSTFVMAGGKFEADIMLVAYDSKQSNDVIINGQTLKPVDGLAKYEAVASGNGERSVEGFINVQGKNGIEKVPFDTKYTVFEGVATVSPDAMNVLYIGLDNPISVSVPGFPPESVTATLNGAGKLGRKAGGKASEYTCTVTQRGEVKISVTVKMPDGSSKGMGEKVFRVRNIPLPIPQLGTLKNGEAETIGTIRANASRVFASLGEGFAFEGVKYKVTNFVFMIAPKRGEAKPPVPVSGDVLSGACTSLVNSIKSGDRIIIDQIRATGPGGNRNLAPIVISAR